MKTGKALFLLILAAQLAGCSAHVAQQHSALPYLSHPVNYYAGSIPPAPQPGSDADKADFAALRDWQAKRTSQQCAQAKAQAEATYDEFFGDISPFPSPLPDAVKEFVKTIYVEDDAIIGPIKSMYKRPRPFRRDAALDPCLGRIDGLAYPSGHSTQAHMVALILSDLVPQRRDEFMARADAAALNRVIGGVHHPSDIAAGAKLAKFMYDEMKTRPEFIAKMNMLRAYLKH
jgi:acid phosphatase (class A)